MYFLAFLIFFSLNFSLWFVFPAIVLKNITKTGRKKHDNDFKTELIVYLVLIFLYIVVYLAFYQCFSTAIINAKYIDNGKIQYFVNDVSILSIVIILFLIVSIILNLFTFYLSRKSFHLNKNNIGYVLCLVTGFLNTVSYWFSNTILKLNMYSFEANKNYLNILIKIDYEMLLFFFPLLVFVYFVYSFLE